MAETAKKAAESGGAVAQYEGHTHAVRKAIARQCAYCLKSQHEAGRNFPTCMACLSTRYCSRECQKADWKTHKPWCQRNQANNLKMKNPETKYGVAPGLFAQIDEKLHGWLSSNRPFLGHVATSATSQFPLPENKPIDGQKNFNIPKEFVLIDLELNERAKERHSKGLTVEGKDAFSFVEMKVVKFAGFDPSMTQQRDALVQQWREKNKRVGRSDYHAPLAVALSMIAVRCQNIGRVSSWVTPLEDLPEVVIKQDLPGLLNTICEDGPDAIEPQAVFGQDC